MSRARHSGVEHGLSHLRGGVAPGLFNLLYGRRLRTFRAGRKFEVARTTDLSRYGDVNRRAPAQQRAATCTFRPRRRSSGWRRGGSAWGSRRTRWRKISTRLLRGSSIAPRLRRSIASRCASRCASSGGAPETVLERHRARTCVRADGSMVLVIEAHPSPDRSRANGRICGSTPPT